MATLSLPNYLTLSLSLFEADTASEVAVYNSVKFCPFVIMSLGSIRMATTFLETHMDIIRLH